jgi:hypothetical protein
MHGKLIALFVAAGEAVVKGQRLAIVEAMKMEHVLTAPRDGTVTEVAGEPGRRWPRARRSWCWANDRRAFRHARACPEHPRLEHGSANKGVDGCHKGDHDDGGDAREAASIPPDRAGICSTS